MRGRILWHWVMSLGEVQKWTAKCISCSEQMDFLIKAHQFSQFQSVKGGGERKKVQKRDAVSSYKGIIIWGGSLTSQIRWRIIFVARNKSHWSSLERSFPPWKLTRFHPQVFISVMNVERIYFFHWFWAKEVHFVKMISHFPLQFFSLSRKRDCVFMVDVRQTEMKKSSSLS